MSGGNSLFGRIAMMRTKLGLSDEEIMNRPWIVTLLESTDLPWYDSEKEDVITDKNKANAILSKYM